MIFFLSEDIARVDPPPSLPPVTAITTLYIVLRHRKVNLSAAGREAILSRQAESLAGVAAGAAPPMEMFTEAFVEVSDLLQRGAFMQFRNSETFLQLKTTWEREVCARRTIDEKKRGRGGSSLIVIFNKCLAS